MLRPRGVHVETYTDRLQVQHHPDPAKDRMRYASLLRRFSADEPHEPRYAYYLGRELCRAGSYAEAIPELERFFRMSDAHDPQERCFAWRVIAWAREQLGRGPDAVLEALLRATAESPHEREPWVELAAAMARVGNWPNCLAAAANALRIVNPALSYRIEPGGGGGG
ncbi:MAG: hypothetical protein NDJ90_15675, partial [Oligoflexia bacterium]|nr:hypothetical protein [Oligoflexia bacterium]